MRVVDLRSDGQNVFQKPSVEFLDRWRLDLAEISGRVPIGAQIRTDALRYDS